MPPLWSLIVVQSSLMGGTGLRVALSWCYIVHCIVRGTWHRVAISHPDDTSAPMVEAQIVWMVQISTQMPKWSKSCFPNGPNGGRPDQTSVDLKSSILGGGGIVHIVKRTKIARKIFEKKNLSWLFTNTWVWAKYKITSTCITNRLLQCNAMQCNVVKYNLMHCTLM